MSQSKQNLTQEETDELVGQLIETGTTKVSVFSAVRKLDDIESGAGEVPSGLSRVCQKCGEEIGDGEEWFTRFGHFYHGDGPEPGCVTATQQE